MQRTHASSLQLVTYVKSGQCGVSSFTPQQKRHRTYQGTHPEMTQVGVLHMQL